MVGRTACSRYCREGVSEGGWKIIGGMLTKICLSVTRRSWVGHQRAAAHGGPNHQRRADQDQILDDVLALQRWGIRHLGKGLGGEEGQRRQSAQHLQKQEQKLEL